MKKSFEPWVKQENKAILTAGAGVFLFLYGIFSLFSGKYLLSAVVIFVAIIFASSAKKSIDNASARRFGVKFEKNSIESIKKEFKRKDIKFKENVMIPGVGDIDLLVQDERYGSIPIEIKSFKYFDLKKINSDSREFKAFMQIRKQMIETKADMGIIWLPQGRYNGMQKIININNNQVKVVLGGNSMLILALTK